MRLFQLCLLCVIAITVKADEDECLFNDDCTGDAKCIKFDDENDLTKPGPGVNKCENLCTINDDCSSGSQCINHEYAAVSTCPTLDNTACALQDQCTFFGRQRREHGVPGGHNDTDGVPGGHNDTGGNNTDPDGSNCQYTGGDNNETYVKTCLAICETFYKKNENGECVFDNQCENTIPPCPHTTKTQCYHIANGQQLQCLCLYPERGHEVANDCECPPFLSPDKNLVCTMPDYTVMQTFEGSDNGYVTEKEGIDDGDTVLQNSYLDLAVYQDINSNAPSHSLPDNTASASFNVKFADSGVVDARFTLDNNESVRVHIELQLGSLITTLFFADTPDSNSTAVYSNQIEPNKWYTISVVLSHATQSMMDITVNVDDLLPTCCSFKKAKILSLQSPLKELTISGNGSVDNVGHKQDNTFVRASDQLTNFDFSKLQCTDTDNCPIKDVAAFEKSTGDSLLYTPDKVIDIESKDAEFFMEYSTTEDTLNYTFINSNGTRLELSFKSNSFTACGQDTALETSAFDIKQRFVVMIKFHNFNTAYFHVSVNGNEEISVNCTNSPFWTPQDIAKAIVVQNYTHTQLHGFSVNGDYKGLSTTSIPATPAPASTKKKKTGTIVGIVGGLVGVCIVIVVYRNREKLCVGADSADKSVLDQLIL